MSLGINLFGTPLFVSNLIVNNPGFEQNLSDWSTFPVSVGAGTTAVTTPVRAGGKALQFGLNTAHYIYRIISVEIGQRYKFGCWAINTASPNYVYIYTERATPDTRKNLVSSSNYVENFISFIATGASLECGIAIDGTANSQAIYVDDFFLYKI